MKNRVLLYILFILILIPFTSALSVELTSPAHGSVYEISNSVNFKCKITGENLVQLTLLTDISGTMEQTGSPISSPTNNTEYTFTVSNIDNGIYNWNCQALSSSTPFQAIGPSDRQLTIDFQNDPPTFSGTIPNQAWDQDTSESNAFDLDDYFSDPDTITYSVSGNSNIDIDITNGQVSFSQPTGWWGVESVTFTATDISGSTDSNEVTLTVSQVNQNNNAPSISGVPDQTKDIDDGDWTLDLDSYIEDNEDSDSNLTISVSNVDTQIFTVSIDQDDNELTFHIEDEGSDDFTITVEDTDGATDSQTITVTIEEETSSSNNDEFNNGEFSIEITTSAPSNTKKLNLEVGQSQKFTITINEDDDIVWYVDSTEVEENKKYYTYKPKTSDAGLHIIKVIVGSGTDKDMVTWDIEVFPEITETITSSLCGNNKIDTNETCLTCPKDVPCEEGEFCDEGLCREKQLSKITGYITKSKDFVIQQWYYPTLILSTIVLLIIISKILSMKKGKSPKKDGDYLAEFSEKLTWKQKLRRRIRAWDRKRKHRTENKESLKRLEKEKKDNIRITAPGVESIITFINQRLDEGNSTRNIKKALKIKGWNRKQIKQAFKQLKNDSRKST